MMLSFNHCWHDTLVYHNISSHLLPMHEGGSSECQGCSVTAHDESFDSFKWWCCAVLCCAGPHMGRWGGLLVAALQAFINFGAGITNIILTGQLLQSIYTNLCTGGMRRGDKGIG
jgi:hypothetical protein